MTRNCDDATSPVIGVMLMLTVTIIIAAVISAYSGSAVTRAQKAPATTVDIHVKNGTTPDTAYFKIQILSVSDPVSTRDLKLVTSWKTTDGFSGGSSSSAGQSSANTVDGSLSTAFAVPTGYGAGVEDWDGAQWGDYSWVAGTTCSDNPSSDYGTGDYTTHTGTDAMQAILGKEWNRLLPGDTVSVRVIHVPSGQVIVNQQVVVEG